MLDMVMDVVQLVP
jgi:hypothetical protein